MNGNSTPTNGGMLVLPESELNARRTEFQNRYRAANNSPSFYNTLELPWTAFRETALEGMDPDKFIIGFIHRYDVATDNWYVAAERFSFDGYSGPGEYVITSTDTLFNILPGGTVGPYDGGLQFYNGHLYDPVYFSHVMAGGTPVDPAIYANRVSFAWEELKQLHCDNRSHIPGADDSRFSIRFTSVTSDYSAGIPGSALVPYPHCVAMYMCYDGQPLLDNSPIISGAVFINKAADFDSVCPPRCASYSWPAGLSPKIC